MGIKRMLGYVPITDSSLSISKFAPRAVSTPRKPKMRLSQFIFKKNRVKRAKKPKKAKKFRCPKGSRRAYSKKNCKPYTRKKR